jgi:hypothetical protein
MKATEKNYAINRVSAILKDRESLLDKEYGVNYSGKIEIKLAEKLAAIKSGKAKVKYNVYGDNPCIDSLFEWPTTKTNRKRQAEYNQKLDNLRKDAQSVKDKLMLGNESEALALLAKFERGKI